MKFVNRAKQLVILPLSTGETVHLAPGEVSRQLEAYETDRNARLDRLVRLGAVAPVGEPAPGKTDKTDKKASGRSSGTS